MTYVNISFSFSTPGYWSSAGHAETFNKLEKLVESKSQNDIDLRVKKVEKLRLKLIKDSCLADCDTHQNEINTQSKNANYKDL